MAQTDKTLFRRFRLWREKDISGTSGTGFVAEGCQFSSNRVVLTFYKELKDVVNIETFDKMEDMVTIHGHEGSTKVVWYD